MKKRPTKPSNVTKEVRSPITNSTEVKLIKKFDSKYFIDHWKEHYNIDISYLFKRTPEFYLYECETSRLRFFYPETIAGDEHVYEQLSSKHAWYYGKNKWEFDVGVKILQETHARSVLEIGAGFGYFLNKAAKLGFQLLGLEFNPKALMNAKKENLPILGRKMKDLVRQGKSFDCIVSFEVFEHLTRPKDYIEESIRLLNPGGTLVIATPNNASFIKYDTILLDLPPHHMLSLGAPFFKSMENIFPLKLVKIYFEPLAEYHIEYYISIMNKYFQRKIPLWRMISRLINPILQRALRIKWIRQCIKGQTILAQFQKKA